VQTKNIFRTWTWKELTNLYSETVNDAERNAGRYKIFVCVPDTKMEARVERRKGKKMCGRDRRRESTYYWNEVKWCEWKGRKCNKQSGTTTSHVIRTFRHAALKRNKQRIQCRIVIPCKGMYTLSWHIIQLLSSPCTNTAKTHGPQNILFHNSSLHRWPPLWSSGQISLLQIRRPGFDSRHYQKKVVGLERGLLSLVSTTEELLDRKVAAPV
jgi:hypothetical protein